MSPASSIDEEKNETTATATATATAVQPIPDPEAINNEKTTVGDSRVIPTPDGVIVDLDSMKDAVYFLFPDRKERLSRFWILLVLAAIIATSGIIGDSPATVIGAMIVAPLMTPILGLMLSIVLLDGPNFRFSLFLVIAGVACCVLVGLIYGFIAKSEVYDKQNNSQVAARVSPKLTDLLGALATGCVGAISLVRKDIAGAVPGVAISISLVPPLCVVGLTMAAGEFVDAAGAILLFTCNLMSIQVTGIVIMYLYNVHKMARRHKARMQRTVFFVLVLLLCAIALPLGVTTRRVARERSMETCVRNTVESWAAPYGWLPTIVLARSRGGHLSAIVEVAGEPPFPDEGDIQEGSERLKAACPELDSAAVTFIPYSVFSY
jgi:uncharacterized hydrophobic protein (TIGR00271 family)